MHNQSEFCRLRTLSFAMGMVLSASAAHAKDVEFGSYTLSNSNVVSVGSSWRVEGRDPRLLGARNIAGGRSPTVTTDDGNLNFNTGDRFSTVVKGVHDFELHHQKERGVFTRIKWFYDEALNKRQVAHGHAPNGYQPNGNLENAGFHPYSRFDGIDVLDAYGYWNFDVKGKEASIRLGRQVVGWGESTLIQSPLSGLNTLDLSAIRRPGVDLKEAFTPSESALFSLSLSPSTSVDALYQLKWRETVTEGCGTYFASNDLVADGCNFVSVPPAGFNDRTAFAAARAGALGTGVFRGPDDNPEDSGQYGLALRHFLNDSGTELGFYYLNYHSRLPVLSALKQTAAVGSSATAGFTSGYIAEYPEDIGILGASFSRSLGAWAWSGEFTHAKDMPLQISTADLLVSVVNPIIGANTYFGRRYQNPAVAGGQKVEGFDRFDVSQVQSTLLRSFDRVLGASRYVFLAEAGATWVHSLPDATTAASAPRYGRSPVFGTASPTIGGQVALPADDGSTTAGFVTQLAWGYRLRATGEYRDAFMGIDVLPQVSWLHDVEGWSPEPGQVFNEGRQALGLGVAFEFDANLRAGINYVKYMNSAAYDVFRDRDFLSLTASYAF